MQRFDYSHSREIFYIILYQHPESKEKEPPTAEEVSSTLDKILENYDHRLRPNISEGPLIIESDVFITGEYTSSIEFINFSRFSRQIIG